MKKLLLCATLVSVAFTSCVTNEELVPEQQSKEISFEVASYVPQTRASGEFDTGETFVANAWANDGSPVQIMKNEIVSYTDSKWKTATTYYWPKEGTVDFICYYPETVEPAITYSYDGNDVLTYANYTVGNEDVMYARKAIRFTANQDAGDNDTSLDYGETYGFEGVPTLFHHALAKLNFKVQNGNYDNDDVYRWEVIVNSITVTGVYNQGKLTLKNTDATTPGVCEWTLPTNSVWTPLPEDDPATPETETPSTTTLSWTGPLTLSNETATVFDEKTVYVLPQTLKAAQQIVTVDYDIVQYQLIDTDSNPATPSVQTFVSQKNYTTDKNLSDGALAHWQMNKNITYTLSFSPIGEMILFAPAVEAWVDAPGSIVVM